MHRTQTLTGDQQAGVRALIEAATAVDGVRPASDQALVQLRGAGTAATHYLRHAGDGTPAGYAQLDRDGSAELVVHPDHRRQGHGRALLDALLVADPNVRVWAHGDLPAAGRLATSAGLIRVRSLWQMSRPASIPLPATPDPAATPVAADVTIRTFTPRHDDEPWVVANAEAFRDHPEQGAMTVADLRARMAESWFDPAGFFVAEREGELIGYHWTKIVGGIGEVYVIGITPGAQGAGLGRMLTLTGLRHLRDRGVEEIVLYVEEDNEPAVRLYLSLGFRRSAIDVQYAR